MAENIFEAPFLAEADQVIKHLEVMLRRLREERERPRNAPDPRELPFFGSVGG